MPYPIRIDVVSDVSCPWCVIGIRALEQALSALQDTVQAEIVVQPFELNPAMPPEGQNLGEHIAEKYGSTPAQSAQNRAMIKARGAEVGFAFPMSEDSRIYNTFDAHRLLHWAGLEGASGQQLALKDKLFSAYFTDGLAPSDHDVLVAAAAAVGLDAETARAVLSSGRYAEEVREAEHSWTSRGIRSVPAVVINNQHLISGGQPAAVFEAAIKQIVAEEAAAKV